MNLTFIAFAATVAAIRVWGARRLAPMSARVWPFISHVKFPRSFGASVLIFAALVCSSQLALAQFTQQGPKLVGTLAVGPAYQGTSVALSGDGNTAIVGAPHDSGNIGAALVWIRSGGAWTQQAKLAGSDWSGESYQGTHVALSSDGNTVIVGGYNDGSAAGGQPGSIPATTTAHGPSKAAS